MRLRDWRPEDVRLLQDASFDEYLCDMLRIRRRLSVAEAREWIRRRGRSSRVQVIEAPEAVGEVGVDTDRSGRWGQIFYWILPRARGQGLVPRALELLLARSSWLVLTAYVSERNHASKRVLEKLGFQRATSSTLWAGYPGPRDTITYFRLS